VVETDVRVVSTTGASAETVICSEAPLTPSVTSSVVMPPTETITSAACAPAKFVAAARTL
jgi:hypothetical protein